jgi:HEAT repeat protein
MSDFQDVDQDQDEGLQIDDSLPPLERLQRYISSNMIIQRLHVVRTLGETAVAVGAADTERVIVPLLRSIQEDPEPVLRQALAEQIAEVARTVPSASYERVLLGELVRTTRQLTVDSNPQVRQSACEALVALGALLKPADHDAHLLAAVRLLADDAADEEHRVEACQLLHSLAPILGGPLCRVALSSQLARLSRDNGSFRVRKAVAANIGNVAAAVAGENGAVEEALEMLSVLAEVRYRSPSRISLPCSCAVECDWPSPRLVL